MTQTRLTCRKPMTLFLIVALIVLVISFSQSVNNSYANEQYRQSTITNVKLERQLKDEWREKIDKKIDELNPPAGEMFATLISLYNYYDVPLYGLVIGNIADAEKQLEETKVKAKEDETYAAKNLYSFDEFGFAVHDLSFPAVVYDYGKDPPSTLLHIFISKFAFKHLCKEIAGCKLAYVQSDEISLLLTDYDTIGTQPWFENNLQKLVSVSASIATLAFNRAFASLTRDLSDEYAYHGVTMRNLWGERTEKNFDAYTTAYCRGATFDARAFILPKEEVCNYFIWRQQDATRNSILVVAQSVLSHKEMQSKKCTELQDILFAQKGINWNHFPTIEKRGACIVKATVNKNGAERREWVVDPDIPIFTQDKKYIDKFVYLNSEATNG